MIALSGKIRAWDAEPFIVRLATGPSATNGQSDAFLTRDGARTVPPGYRACLAHGTVVNVGTGGVPVVALPEALGYLADGDVVRVAPRGGIVNVLYRKASPHNSVFVTERCNSNCVMCSQPPVDADDGYLVDVWLAALPLMDPETRELGITGGEPTLLEDGLLRILACARDHLPRAAVHVLSNGRLLRYLSLARAVADVRHPDLMFGIPLYADVGHRHDFVVQAAGAFDDTLRGIMNLGRCGVPVEVRVVLHRHTVDRLPQLARFIARNLPFVDHVALMGLEMMGYVKMNLDALWVDPVDYQAALRRAVETLVAAGMNVSVYNHPLCVLDPALWPYARKSISDWKNEYVPACGGCAARGDCGGLFTSGVRVRHSRGIAAIATRHAEGAGPAAHPAGAGPPC